MEHPRTQEEANLQDVADVAETWTQKALQMPAIQDWKVQAGNRSFKEVQMKHLFLLASACLALSACQQIEHGSGKGSSGSGRSDGTTDTHSRSGPQEGKINQPQEVQGRRADDTGRNVRDRNEQALTAGSQSENEADRLITQKARQAIVADDSLSTNAHNVKIITINGIVTLRGVVNNEREKNIIAQKVRSVNGVRNLDNQLEVAKSDTNSSGRNENSRSDMN